MSYYNVSYDNVKEVIKRNNTTNLSEDEIIRELRMSLMKYDYDLSDTSDRNLILHTALKITEWDFKRGKINNIIDKILSGVYLSTEKLYNESKGIIYNNYNQTDCMKLSEKLSSEIIEFNNKYLKEFNHPRGVWHVNISKVIYDTLSDIYNNFIKENIFDLVHNQIKIMWLSSIVYRQIDDILSYYDSDIGKKEIDRCITLGLDNPMNNIEWMVSEFFNIYDHAECGIYDFFTYTCGDDLYSLYSIDFLKEWFRDVLEELQDTNSISEERER